MVSALPPAAGESENKRLQGASHLGPLTFGLRGRRLFLAHRCLMTSSTMPCNDNTVALNAKDSGPIICENVIYWIFSSCYVYCF